MAGMLEAASLAALSDVRHAFFVRAGGISEGVYATLNGGIGSRDQPERVFENRARMAAALGVAPDRLLTAYQTHSSDAARATHPWAGDARPRADGLVTRERGLAIAITTADCGPILMADAAAGVIGAAHAGWRGALAGIIESTIAAMEEIGAQRSRIVAALGPMIRQPNYEVGPEFVAAFLAHDAANEVFFRSSQQAHHSLFDLSGYIVSRLTRAQIAHIEDLGECTYADPERFFSYRRSTHRRESDYGRHVSAIALAS